MNRNDLFRYKIATLAIPVIVILFFLSKDFFINIISQVPPCPVYSNYHVYCPACGNTRCVKALLHGDIKSGLRYNITPILFGFFFLLAYIELATYSFGRHIHLLPRRLRIYIILIILLVIYLILRNFVPYLTP